MHRLQSFYNQIHRKYRFIERAQCSPFYSCIHTKSIYRGLAENGINVKTTPITFVGGGAGLMKEYAGITSRNISYIEDVKSNAKGYEQLAKMYLANKRGA